MLVRCKGTANMTKQIIRRLRERLKVRSGGGSQHFKVCTMMIMRDNAAGDAPEPLNAMRIRVIGRRVDQRQLIAEVGQHAAHEQGPVSGVGLEIVSNDNRYTSPRFRTSYRRTHLVAKDISRSSCGNPAIKPPVAPVYQPKTVDLAVVSRSFDETLAAPTFEAPDPRERGVKGKLHLILQVKIGSREQRQQLGQISGKQTPQISFDQVPHG